MEIPTDPSDGLVLASPLLERDCRKEVLASTNAKLDKNDIFPFWDHHISFPLQVQFVHMSFCSQIPQKDTGDSTAGYNILISHPRTRDTTWIRRLLIYGIIAGTTHILTPKHSTGESTNIATRIRNLAINHPSPQA
jgi:hypothetical protein